MVLSGFINAARLASAASGRPLNSHKILFFGAGSAGIGVAKQLISFFTLLGMSEEEAKGHIYVRSSTSYRAYFMLTLRICRRSTLKDSSPPTERGYRNTKSVSLIYIYRPST